jgi:hypothetical protein
MKNIHEFSNLSPIKNDELKKIDGGSVILACIAIGVAWSAIGATLCWEMGKDNRE